MSLVLMLKGDLLELFQSAQAGAFQALGLAVDPDMWNLAFCFLETTLFFFAVLE